jgi:hypothetical protein
MSMNEGDGDLSDNLKNLALKAKDTDQSQGLEKEEEDDEDPFALMTKALTRILKMKKNYNRDRPRSSYKDNKGKSGGNSNKSKPMNCFECGDADHLVKDCPQKKKQQYPRRDRDKKKRAMVASWSDSDSSDESDSEEEQANLCLMAEQESSDKHIEVMVNNLISSPKHVLSEMLKNMFKNEESYLNEIKTLKVKLHEHAKESLDLTYQNRILESSKAKSDRDLKALEINFKTLKTQAKEVADEYSVLSDNFIALKVQHEEIEDHNIALTEQLKESKELIAKFNCSEHKLDLMLSSKSIHKHGIGYNPNFPKKTNTVFVKAKSKKSPTCSYCCKIGHVRFTCPFRRTEPHIIRNNFPLQLKGQIKQIWVKKGTRPPNMIDDEYDVKFNTWSKSWVRH